MNYLEHLEKVLADLDKNTCTLTHVIADNPKRAFLRNSLSHGARYPCEYCSAQGISLCDTEYVKNELLICQKNIQDIKADINMTEKVKKRQIAELNSREFKLSKTTQIVWPSECTGPKRTIQDIRECVGNITNDIKHVKGILGPSPLLDFQNFDFIYGIPTEYLHSVCIGLVKRLLELCFTIGDNRSRITTRKLSSTLKFNAKMTTIKVPREFSRRCRKLDFAVMKAQELRNIVLFFFPLIINLIEENAKERHVWLALSFCIRACILPENEYSSLLLSPIITKTMSIFYTYYESLFGPHNCTYTVHVITNHLLDMRIHGPLTETSAFDFETFYGELRRSFTPGTTNPLKQIFQQVMLKRLLRPHVCNNKIYYSKKETPLESNSMIYVYENNQHSMHKIVDIGNSGKLICVKQGRYHVSFPELPNLPWSSVGVYKKGPLTNKQKLIEPSEVHGKVLNVADFLITCPINILHEK